MKNSITEEQALSAAIEDGWALDSSPQTEMSNDIWWRFCPTQSPVRQDSLIAKYIDKLEKES